jgi:hypothetical protein
MPFAPLELRAGAIYAEMYERSSALDLLSEIKECFEAVGWVEPLRNPSSAVPVAMGFVSLNPSYGLIVPFGRSAYIVRYAHDEQRQEIVIVRLWHGRETRI